MKNFALILLFVSPSFAWGTEALQVMTMECEISIPYGYKLDARLKGNNNHLRFFTTGDGYGQIRIGSIEEVSDELKLVKEKEYEHLKVITYEYGSDSSIRFDVIRSFDQEITLSGDATNLTNSFVDQCLDSVDRPKVQVLEREAKGCVTKVDLRKQFSNLYEGVRFGVNRSIQDGEAKTTGLRVGDISKESDLAKLGVKESDLITHACGIPFGQVLKSVRGICCQEESVDSIRLTILRKGEAAMNIIFPAKSLTKK